MQRVSPWRRDELRAAASTASKSGASSAPAAQDAAPGHRVNSTPSTREGNTAAPPLSAAAAHSQSRLKSPSLSNFKYAGAAAARVLPCR